MVLSVGQVTVWLAAIFLSAMKLCALFALVLFSRISKAGELEELSVTESEGEYRLQIVSVLDAPADYVYRVTTDYLHAYRINPTITEVEILPSGRDEVVRVWNLSEQCVGTFCFSIDWVGDIEEPGVGNLKVETIPELSSFESGSAVWQIRPLGEHTLVYHESSLKPDFFIPPVIGNKLMKNQLKGPVRVNQPKTSSAGGINIRKIKTNRHWVHSSNLSSIYPPPSILQTLAVN